jgi:hypothetical protein
MTPEPQPNPFAAEQPIEHQLPGLEEEKEAKEEPEDSSFLDCSPADLDNLWDYWELDPFNPYL